MENKTFFEKNKVSIILIAVLVVVIVTVSVKVMGWAEGSIEQAEAERASLVSERVAAEAEPPATTKAEATVATEPEVKLTPAKQEVELEEDIKKVDLSGFGGTSKGDKPNKYRLIGNVDAIIGDTLYFFGIEEGYIVADTFNLKTLVMETGIRIAESREKFIKKYYCENNKAYVITYKEIFLFDSELNLLSVAPLPEKIENWYAIDENLERLAADGENGIVMYSPPDAATTTEVIGDPNPRGADPEDPDGRFSEYIYPVEFIDKNRLFAESVIWEWSFGYSIIEIDTGKRHIIEISQENRDRSNGIIYDKNGAFFTTRMDDAVYYYDFENYSFTATPWIPVEIFTQNQYDYSSKIPNDAKCLTNKVKQADGRYKTTFYKIDRENEKLIELPLIVHSEVRIICVTESGKMLFYYDDWSDWDSEGGYAIAQL